MSKRPQKRSRLYSETGELYSETGKLYSETGSIQKLGVTFGNSKPHIQKLGGKEMDTIDLNKPETNPNGT